MSEMNWSEMEFAPVSCCLCGSLVTQSNDAKMCLNCIKSQVDISEDIPKRVSISWCKGCGRYLEPPSRWMVCTRESKELLSFCLKRVRGLNSVRLIDANFLWTEPHSKRIKIKLTCQKNVYNSIVVEQVFVIEFVVCNYFCPDCHKFEAGGAENSWKAVAQVRQRVSHKRTFYWLEQCILKYHADEHALFIKQSPDGLDFYFDTQNNCKHFVDFICSMTPSRYQISKQLLSHDTKCNTYAHRYAYSVELAPFCREDLVFLTPKLSTRLGGFSLLCLVYKISSLVHLIDPITLKTCELPAEDLWSNACRSVATKRELVKFFILDSELVGNGQHKNHNYMLSEATVARPTDLGKNDNQFITMTHLGKILKPGDDVLGYDLSNVNFTQEELEGIKKHRFQLPELFLVKKLISRSPGRRKWSLKLLGKEYENVKHSVVDRSADYEDFLQELEEDPFTRSHVNFYAERDLNQQLLQLDSETNFNELIDGIETLQI